MSFIKKCDICGVACNPTELRSDYQTKEIKEVCDECLKPLNDLLWAMRRVWWKQEEKFLKRKIREMHKRGGSK